VKAIDPNRSMLWEGKNTTWAWRLYKLDERRTRLGTRVHMHYDLMSPFRSLVRPRPLRHDAQDVAGVSKQRAEAGARRTT